MELTEQSIERMRFKALTKRQSEVYNYLIKYVAKNKISPTYNEISQDCDLGGTSNAYRIIKDLMNKKLVTRIGNTTESRSIYPIIDKNLVRD